MGIRLCDFSALRCFLVVLNTFYIAVAFFLVGVVIAARTLAYSFGIEVSIGIAIAAAFLFCVAVLGMVGVLRHNQVIMFFYMVLLGFAGVLLFALSVAALAIPESYTSGVFSNAWKALSYEYKGYIQDSLNCCGFSEDDQLEIQTSSESAQYCSQGHPRCNSTILLENCCRHKNESSRLVNTSDSCLHEIPLLCPECQPCYGKWHGSVIAGMKTAGALGLIFSLTQIIGIVLTVRFRDLKDPNFNPRDVL